MQRENFDLYTVLRMLLAGDIDLEIASPVTFSDNSTAGKRFFGALPRNHKKTEFNRSDGEISAVKQVSPAAFKLFEDTKGNLEQGLAKAAKGFSQPINPSSSVLDSALESIKSERKDKLARAQDLPDTLREEPKE